MASEDMGLADIGDARDEAEQIVKRWLKRTNSVNFKIK